MLLHSCCHVAIDQPHARDCPDIADMERQMANLIAHRAGALDASDTNSIQQTTELDYFLIDGSGSMSPKWWDFLAAGDTFLTAAKQNGLKSHLVVHVFDTADMEMIQRDCPLRDAKPFHEEPLGSHFQGTPLYDAINLMGRRLRERNPTKASILIITDGDDADSKTSVEDAKRILDWIKARGWQVTFFGCDFNNSRQAKLLGMDDSNTIGVQQKLLSDAARNLAAKRSAYSRDGTDISFSDKEKQQFGGYLADNSNGRP